MKTGVQLEQLAFSNIQLTHQKKRLNSIQVLEYSRNVTQRNLSPVELQVTPHPMAGWSLCSFFPLPRLHFSSLTSCRKGIFPTLTHLLLLGCLFPLLPLLPKNLQVGKLTPTILTKFPELAGDSIWPKLFTNKIHHQVVLTQTSQARIATDHFG